MSIPALLLVLLVVWHLVYLAAVFRRHVRFGLAITGYSIVWYSLLTWAGVAWTTTLTVLTVLEAISIIVIALYSPRVQRIIALAFATTGVLLAVGRWIGPSAEHWRVITAVLIGFSLSILGLGYFLTGFGKFGVISLRGRGASARYGVAKDAVHKYTYWSKRAIDSIISDNKTGSRFSLKLAEINPPNLWGFGFKLSFEKVVAESGRHAAAQQLERQLAASIHTDVKQIDLAGGGFMAGKGDVYITAYGSQSVDESPTGGRAAMFTNWTAEDGKRIAVCLFGSMDNFDGWIRDSHPAAVTGWASSATQDVMRWLQQSEAWDIKRWNESLGNVACKMANYKIAIDERRMPRVRNNYERDLVAKHSNAEWFSLIYHTEARSEYLEAPFDIVLVGRPIWLRSTYFSVKTADECTESEINESWERSYASFWQEKLLLRDHRSGWPLYLYRCLLSRQGITPKL